MGPNHRTSRPRRPYPYRGARVRSARQPLLKLQSDEGSRASAMVALDDDLAGERLAAPAGVGHAQALAYLLEGLRPQCHALTDLAIGHGVADTHVPWCSSEWEGLPGLIARPRDHQD